MKKIVLFTLLLLSLSISHAQKSNIEEYCSIEMKSNFYEPKKGVTIGVNYGKGDSEILKDAEGKVIKFSSGIEVLNFMSKNGWSLISVSPSSGEQYTVLGKTNIVIERSIFLFKRKVVTNDE